MIDRLAADHLLDHAERLLEHPDAATQVDRRRAVSAAYYAAFHAVAVRRTRQVLAEMDPLRPATAQALRLTRRLSHSAVARAAREFERSGGGKRTVQGADPSRHAPQGPDEDRGATPEMLLRLASDLQFLREEREIADYDHGTLISLQDALYAVGLARDIVDLTGSSGESTAFRSFLATIALQGR